MCVAPSCYLLGNSPVTLALCFCPSGEALLPSRGPSLSYTSQHPVHLHLVAQAKGRGVMLLAVLPSPRDPLPVPPIGRCFRNLWLNSVVCSGTWNRHKQTSCQELKPVTNRDLGESSMESQCSSYQQDPELWVFYLHLGHLHILSTFMLWIPAANNEGIPSE